MARTLTLNRMSVCCVVLVLCLFRIDGAQAVSNSSGAVVGSSDQSTSDGGVEESTMEKGMRPFFDMVQGFLGVVQPKRIHEESWLNLSEIVQDGELQSDQLSDWKNWVLYLVGFVVCAAIGVLFILVMPITGLIFCCCRCTGRCGGKAKAHDPKHAGCKRTTYCTLLLVFNTLALAGVVCTFLSNQILYDKMRNENDQGPTGRLIHSTNLINGFVNDTINDVEVAVLVPFLDSKDDIIRDISNSAEEAVQAVLNTLNTISLLFQSKKVADDVKEIRTELSNVADRLQTLSSQGQQLSENLTALGNEIDSVCVSGTPCHGFDTSKFAISANFSGLDTLSAELTKVEAAVDLDKQITQAEDTINSTKTNATDTVSTSISEATDSIDSVENNIRSAVSDITTDLQGEITEQVEKFRSDIRDSQDDILKYSQYVWYGGLGIACALLLVVVLYYMGILFGLCGERPGFGAQCCNTGTGANFLMAGVGFTFILSWLIMLVCIITFVLGGPLYTELCRYFDDHKPEDLKPFSDAVMNYVDLEKSLFHGQEVDLSLVTILEDCKKNSAVYSALKLDYMVNLTEKLDLTEVDTALEDFKMKTFNIPDITILTKDMNDSLGEFADAGLDNIPFDQYYEQVNKGLTKEDLDILAGQLRTAAASMPLPGKGKLLSVADQLQQLQTDVVAPMQEAEDSLKASLDKLQNQPAPGIKQSTEKLQQDLQRTEDNFNQEKNTRVANQVYLLVRRVMTTIQGLVDDTLEDVYHNVGKCRPIYDSFYSASDAACVMALEPLNGLWFSMGWCLFFFIPSLIFAVKLAGLYRREHEERDFDDPNFNLYSEGRNKDSLPLTSLEQQQQRQQESGGRGSMVSGGGEDRQSRGVSNSAYQADSYLGPSDFPNYKGGAVNAAYHDDGYDSPRGPPPYRAQPYSYGHQGEIPLPAYDTVGQERPYPTAPSLSSNPTPSDRGAEPSAPGADVY